MIPEGSWLLTRIATANEMVKSLDEAASARDFGAGLLAITASFGVESVLAGAIPEEMSRNPPGPCERTPCWRPVPPPIADSEPPTQASSFFINPSRTHLFDRILDTGEVAHWIVDCARCRDAWIQGGEGLLFPVVAEEAVIYGLGFFGPALSSGPDLERSLAFLAHYAFARMLKIDCVNEAPRFSERQILALKWAAEGKTDQEIAAILNVSGHTVDKYMRQIKQELKAVNRTSAIVIAMRSGLIT